MLPFFILIPPCDIQVHPSDVMGPSVPGPIVLLVDCPTLSHFLNLLSLQCLGPYYIDTTNDVPESSKIVSCVIHLTPLSVTQTDDYETWMSKFGAAQHIMAGHEMLVSLNTNLFLNLIDFCCFDCLCVFEPLELMDSYFQEKHSGPYFESKC